MTTAVLNLSTGAWSHYTLPPLQGVVAAHAQTLSDWNTWDYARRYHHLVRCGQCSVGCGDFAALFAQAVPPTKEGAP